MYVLFYEFPDIFLNNLQYWHFLYCFGFNLKKKSCKYLQSTVEYLTEYLQIHIWRSRKTLDFFLLNNNRSWSFIKFCTRALELLFSFLQFQNFIEQVPHHDKWVFKLAAFHSWLRFKGLFPEEFWWMLPCGSAFHTQDQFS